MIIHALHETPEAVTPAALDRFESAFRHPLGGGLQFSVSHAPEHGRFYASIGHPSWRFVAERDGEILGSLSLAQQSLLEPKGGVGMIGYLGDLKAAPGAMRGRILQRLALAALPLHLPGTTRAYGLVMAGAAARPDAYSGRCGIPALKRHFTLQIVRLESVPPEAGLATGMRHVSAEEGSALFRNLVCGRAASLGGKPKLRSERPPVWLAARDGTACGRLEDTFRAKRLMLTGGGELRSSHLACFAWNRGEAAADLVVHALGLTHAAGCPALFFACPESDYPQLAPFLTGGNVQVTSASVFGLGPLPPAPWILHSSEI